MEPHDRRKKSFDLGGNRTHDLRIRSTVNLPTELQGRTFSVQLILSSTICVSSATRHNVRVCPYFLFAAIHHLKSAQLAE